MANVMWNLVGPHKGKKIIENKQVFLIKLKPDRSLERYKSRLVAKVYDQIEKMDYNETFSFVVKQVTIGVVLPLALTKNWMVRQLDVNNEFLNGELDKKIYVIQPQRFMSDEFLNHACKLKKALYGLKEAHKACFNK